jgi:hypothetical protein
MMTRNTVKIAGREVLRLYSGTWEATFCSSAGLVLANSGIFSFQIVNMGKRPPKKYEKQVYSKDSEFINMILNGIVFLPLKALIHCIGF